MILVFFYEWEESGVNENFSLDVYLNCVCAFMQIYAFLKMVQNAFCFSPSWIPQGVNHPWAIAVANSLILVELKWQATLFYFTLRKVISSHFHIMQKCLILEAVSSDVPTGYIQAWEIRFV